jgi:hypothetical protein
MYQNRTRGAIALIEHSVETRTKRDVDTVTSGLMRRAKADVCVMCITESH